MGSALNLMRNAIAVAGLMLCAGDLAGQRPIQDNSFLIEEAYNQERGVLQHIQSFQRDLRGAGFLYQFTQEWPVRSLAHQFSYTLAALRDDGVTTGLGDSRVNYRYQLMGDGDAAVAIAPRVTAVLPTGNWKRGRGAGAPGVEAWLPASVALSERFVTHLNAGLTWTSRARNASGATATTTTLSTGASVIWLAHRRFNAMLEGIHARSQRVVSDGRVANNTGTTVSPGIRWSYDFPSGLQIVPGVALPITSASGEQTRAVILYLSFEHPFSRQAR
jgi:hypothetical protein